MKEVKAKLEELKESWRVERDASACDRDWECGYYSALCRAMLELHLVIKEMGDED